jgi:autotransporter-associated beta strand protein
MLIAALAPLPAHAQDATWLEPPETPTNDFNLSTNWTPAVVPGSVTSTGTAFFGESNQTSPLIEAATTLGQIEFTNSATENYTIGVGFVGTTSLVLNGPGVTNSSGITQGFVIGTNGTLVFIGGATAGTNTEYLNEGAIDFFSSTAGSASFQNENNGTMLFNNSHAGSGEIDNNAGMVTFENGSNADTVKIFSGATSPSIVTFSNSTAGSAEILNLAGSSIFFTGNSSGGQATITTFGTIEFFNTSTAAQATITNHGDSVEFFNTSTAGAASILVDGIGNVTFHQGSTAGTSTMTAGVKGSTDDFTGGFIRFFDNSKAGTATGSATITAYFGSNIEFHNESDAVSATITANNSAFIFFNDTATADHANITVNTGGEMDFSPDFADSCCSGGAATADHAIITNNGVVGFYQESSAAKSTITTNAGGVTSFYGRSSGGNAAFITNAGGVVDFSGLGTFPDTGEEIDKSITGTTAGSIAGEGNYYLGSKQLTVGGNNLSTTVSGVISDCGSTGVACNTPGATRGSLVVDVGKGNTLTLTGNNTYTGGTTIMSGALSLGNDGTTGSIIGPVDTIGVLEFDHDNTLVIPGAISGSGSVAQIGTGTTILMGANTYSGLTTISAGTLEAGGVGVFSANSHTVVQSGGTLDLHGFDQILNNGLENSGTVKLGVPDPTAPGTTLTVAGNYVGGTAILPSNLWLNTYLGADNSPSDQLIVNGGSVTGETLVHVTNVGGPGAETTGDGILVVKAIDGATTTPGAFALYNGEVREGAFDYDLFRGGVSGDSLNSWFLRSDFIVPPIPPEPPIPPIPPDPPPTPLPPGVYPIIGPELATYGVVQPLARQLGFAILGTLDDRVGDTYEPDGCWVAPAVAPAVVLADLPTRKPGPAPAPCPLFSPSIWGRFFGETINNHYQAFADPRANGNLGGFQGGIDLLRGSLIAGHCDRAGFYGAYGDVTSDVNGLVTNPQATAYILTRTGQLNLTAVSGGAYWTHVGPGGWYLDGVLQGTSYGGSASTEFARLNTFGWGFIASLEGGYPFALPQFGPGFAIEPQGQIAWQKVSFGHEYDGLGDVALGDTTGPSGRIGLRGMWTIVTAGGQVWQPYLRANLWED